MIFTLTTKVKKKQGQWGGNSEFAGKQGSLKFKI